MRNHLGFYEQLVLQAVEHLWTNATGSAILNEIKKRTGLSATPSTIYLILRKLVNRKLLSSKIGVSKSRGRRSIKYFKIEATGRRGLTQTRRMLKKMWAQSK